MAKVAIPDGFDPALLDEALLARLVTASPHRPRGETETILRALLPVLTVTPDGPERARVRFPKPLEGLALAVRRAGGIWYLAEAPEER